MKSIKVGELKANFSDILNQIQNMGESFIIEYGKSHKKVAILKPYKENKQKRVFGQLKGKIKIPQNFNDEDEEINKMFYGKTL